MKYDMKDAKTKCKINAEEQFIIHEAYILSGRGRAKSKNEENRIFFKAKYRIIFY